MAMRAKQLKRRAIRPARTSTAGSETTRDRSLHFRVSSKVADLIEKAAAAERRTVSAWVAICVEDRLRRDQALS